MGATMLGGAVLLTALLATYANHFHNSFHFDDAHTIENNAAIRDLRNIPQFFRDATTFSALPSNQSYRPLVSTLLAIDYHLGSGLQPFWFHLSVFTLFATLTLGLAFVVYRLLECKVRAPANLWIALAAAGWYGLHPANADTVNYLIASSEVISTLGVVGSFSVYFGFPRLRRYYLFALPAALGILAKPPAAVFAVLFAIFSLLFDDEPEIKRGKSRIIMWLKKCLPPLILCGATLFFVQQMTPRTWVAGAANARSYVMTQPYVALLYFKTFFWPSGLSADYDIGPFTSTGITEFWIGLAFLIAILGSAIGAAVFTKTRIIGFGLLWFLIALLPTSLFPLAEVMNDHRTFFPYIGLIIAIAGLASVLINCDIEYSRVKTMTAGCAVILFLVVNGWGTWNRNKVWKTEETLWHDVTIKSPVNARGLMNYGTTLMARADMTGALDYFHRAQVLAPYYPVLLINLAIAEDTTNQYPKAEQHFREALQLAPSTPDSYTFYARSLVAHGRPAEALALLDTALKFSPGDATAQALLARVQHQTSASIQTPESYLAMSLQYYREERYEESIDACHSALALRPGYAEAWNNIGAAYNKLGQFAKGISACEEALRLRPDFPLARNNLEYARSMLKKAGS